MLNIYVFKHIVHCLYCTYKIPQQYYIFITSFFSLSNAVCGNLGMRETSRRYSGYVLTNPSH